jgi:TP901 family phage tail tape measure protein
MANKKLSAVITIGGAVASSLSSAFGTVKNQIGQVGSALRRAEREQRTLSDAIQTFGRMGKNVDGLREKYAALTTQIDKLRNAHQSLARVQAAQDANLAKRANLRGQMFDTVALGASVLLPTAGAIKKASEFQYQLQLIGNTADMTKAEVMQLGDVIKQASISTGQSATNMQQAIGFLVAAGMDVKVARDVVSQVGLAATATGADIEDLAKAAFTLNDALKIAPGQAMALALDTLAQAGKEGNVELKDMAKQLPVLGAGFVSLKMEGREAAATMAAALEVARKGAADADEAANNMKNFISKIMSPETLKKAEKNFDLDLYGIITKAQESGKNPFEASMEAIIKATEGDQKKIGELFQDMQVQNFLRPMIQQWDEYKRIKDKALDARGVIDRDAQKIRATFKQQLTEASNAAERLSIAIGDSLTPAVGGLLKIITPVINSMATFVTEHKTLVAATVLTVGSLTALRVATLAAGFAFTFVRGGMLSFIGQLVKLRAGAALASNALPGIVAGIRAIGVAFISTGIGAIIAGIAIGGTLIYQHWDGVSAFMVGTFEGIKSGLQPLVATFSAFWEVLKPLHPIVDAIGSALGRAWDWFVKLLQPVSYSADELNKAGAAGRSFGENLALGIQLVLLPLTKLIE